MDFGAEFVDWLLAGIDYLFGWLFFTAFTELGSFFEGIGAPSFIAQAGNIWSGMPSSVLWGLDLFEVPAGLAMIGVAWVTRFSIRRIPIIG